MTKQEILAAIEEMKGSPRGEYDAGYEKALEDVIEMLQRRLPDKP